MRPIWRSPRGCPDAPSICPAPTEGGAARFELGHTDTGSWACVDYRPGDVEFAVRQYGPRRLWDEVEAAYLWWLDAGRPDRDRFGLTVTPDRQYVWLENPAHKVA